MYGQMSDDIKNNSMAAAQILKSFRHLSERVGIVALEKSISVNEGSGKSGSSMCLNNDTL